MEGTSYNGVLVWKISNFAKKKQDAMSGTQPSIYSQCFYSSRFGYKMCARYAKMKNEKEHILQTCVGEKKTIHNRTYRKDCK